jgi:hypothetical protein
MKVLLFTLNRTGMPSFRKVLLRSYYAYPALPIEGEGSLQRESDLPEKIVE